LAPGGFILFRRNIGTPAQVARLCADLRALYPADDPPLISVDQEGGRVARLRAPFTELPSARVLGGTTPARGSLRTDRAAAAVTARELTAVGINFNYAPVLDVDSNPANPIIGDRAYGGRPSWSPRGSTRVIETYQRRRADRLRQALPRPRRHRCRLAHRPAGGPARPRVPGAWSCRRSAMPAAPASPPS
jgi:beta-N-acetylhexosaminidase